MVKKNSRRRRQRRWTFNDCGRQLPLGNRTADEIKTAVQDTFFWTTTRTQNYEAARLIDKIE